MPHGGVVKRFRPKAVQQYLAPENQGRLMRGRYPSEMIVGAGVVVGTALVMALGLGTDVPNKRFAHGVLEYEEGGRAFGRLSVPAGEDLQLAAGQELPLSIAGAASSMARIHAVEFSTGPVYAVRVSFPATGRPPVGSSFEAALTTGRVSLLRSVLPRW
jgi:hypothetical protein